MSRNILISVSRQMKSPSISAASLTISSTAIPVHGVSLESWPLSDRLSLERKDSFASYQKIRHNLCKTISTLTMRAITARWVDCLSLSAIGLK